MIKKKPNKQEIENKILGVVNHMGISLSIRQITLKLREMFDIRLSPQVVKRYLLKLKKEGKIIGK